MPRICLACKICRAFTGKRIKTIQTRFEVFEVFEGLWDEPFLCRPPVLLWISVLGR